MALPTASDNAFPSLLLTEGTVPAAPAAGKHRLYVDTADKLLKWEDSGAVVRLATGQPLGLTGAVSATRYVGGTASVAPITGTFAIGDFVITQAGGIYICTVAGTPGTWVAVAGGSGAVATDVIWDAAGDLVQGTGANTGAKLAAGTAGMMLKSAGAAAANLWAFPPGYEFDYVEITANVTVTAVTEGTANTAITGTSVAYDGATVVMVEFFAQALACPGAGSAPIKAVLFDGATVIGEIAQVYNAAATYAPTHAFRRLTPSNGSHQYIVKAYVAGGTGYVIAGAGGTGASVPAFLRVTKV